MKFIGRSGKNYIVEIKEIEICNILGFDGLYCSGYKEFKSQYEEENSKRWDSPMMLDGATIDVSPIAKKAKLMRENEHKIKSAIETFRGMADALEMAWPSLKNTTEQKQEQE